MAGSRRPKTTERNRDHVHMSGRLFVIAMAVLAVLQTISVTADSTLTNNDTAAAVTECSGQLKCAECQRAVGCGWSSERWTCGTAVGASVNSTACPSVRAVTRPVADGDTGSAYTYVMAVSGDIDGVVRLVASADLRCHVGGTVVEVASVVRDGADQPPTVRIECSPVPLATLLRNGRWTDVRHAHVAADGVPLRPDRPDDRYFAVQGNGTCGKRRRDWIDECARCAWTDPHGYAHYLRRCPGRVVPCAGPTAFYDRRNASTLARVDVPRPVTVAVPLSPCPQFRVRSFAPAHAPWTGGATLRVHVTNHRVLAENAVLSVTVGGRRCLPSAVAAAVEPDEFSCTVASFVAGDRLDTGGPIRVKYEDVGPDAVTVELTSAEDFSFDYPHVANVSRYSTLGPDRSGRTVFTVSGDCLDAGRGVHVTVDDSECVVTERLADRLLCWVDGEDVATTGHITMEFRLGGDDPTRAPAVLRVYVVQSPWSVRVGDATVRKEVWPYGAVVHHRKIYVEVHEDEGLTFVRAMCHVLRTFIRVTVVVGIVFVIWKLTTVCFVPTTPRIYVKFCTPAPSTSTPDVCKTGSNLPPA